MNFYVNFFFTLYSPVCRP